MGSELKTLLVIRNEDENEPENVEFSSAARVVTRTVVAVTVTTGAKGVIGMLFEEDVGNTELGAESEVDTWCVVLRLG